MVIVMVSLSLSWASAGKEGIKTRMIASAMLAIRLLLCSTSLLGSIIAFIA